MNLLTLVGFICILWVKSDIKESPMPKLTLYEEQERPAAAEHLPTGSCDVGLPAGRSFIEEWRDIRGYEGRYQVSSLGRVRSLGWLIVTKLRGSYRRQEHGKILTPNFSFGYCYVSLYKDGRAERTRVHKLVIETFIGLGRMGLQVNHKDGNKLNNTPDNLEWSTPLENIRHAFRLGLVPIRKSRICSTNKLTTSDVLTIRALADKMPRRELAQKFGINKRYLQDIIYKRARA